MGTNLDRRQAATGERAGVERAAPAELATRLALADDQAQAKLLAACAPLADINLAQALKKLYDDTRSSDPRCATGAAAALVGWRAWSTLRRSTLWPPGPRVGSTGATSRPRPGPPEPGGD